MDAHLPTDGSIDARLARIEAELAAAKAQARRWRAGTLAAGAVLGAGALLAAQQVSPVVDVVRTKRLEIVGEGDKVVLLAHAAETGGQMDVWSKGGANTVRIASNDQGGDVAVWNAGGKPVGGLFATELGGRIEVGDSDGKPLATVARGEEGGALILSGAGDAARSMRAEAGAAGAVISMRRADGEIGLIAGVAQGASVLSMKNSNGKEILYAGGATDQTGVVRIADAAGNENAALVAGDGGRLILKDGAGAVAASIASAGAGKGGMLELLNGKGSVAVSADSKEDGGGRFMVGTSSGAPAFMAEATGQAGTMGAYLNERRIAAMGAGQNGGLLNLFDLAGQPIVVTGAAPDGDGGALSVRNTRGVQIARIGVDSASAGEVAVYNSTANVKKVIAAPAASPAK
jgi:hypothetical protein